MKSICVASFVLLVFVSMCSAQRLPSTVVPENYKLTFTPDLANNTFAGQEIIRARVEHSTPEILLNAVDINFEEVTVTSGRLSQKAKVSLDKETEQAKLTTERPIEAGPVTIQVKYTGILNNELRGFYIGKQDDGRKYAATQLEATDARRAFPSFDEPAFKATFDITVVADKGLNVISNTKALSDVDGPSAGKHTVHFATTPKMSCYLVAMVIGDFEFIEGSADGIPVRVYTNPGKKHLAAFALKVAEESLHYYDHYFGIKYPYGKLDMIGLSDFGPGAMENTGCITYREAYLMLDEKHAALETRKFIASVIAHEIAHQWFGDLVTMKWWDDIWLNEGFASWMSSKPLQAWKPEWHVELNDVNDAAHAMDRDSLENTHPIHQEAQTPAQILELADDITYDKTAAVLRMMESYLGEDTFRRGINSYLKQHAYGNATAADLWNALAQASGKPVDKIMASFVDQPGPPMVSATAKCEGGSERLNLSQQRYVFDRSKFEAAGSELWQIPVCMKDQSRPGEVKCELLTGKEHSFSLPACASWIDVNAGARGFYRSGYDEKTVRALAKDAANVLTPAERIMLLNDVWASVRVDRENIGDYLLLAEGLASDPNPLVNEPIVQRLQFIGRYLVNDSDADAYRAWVHRIFEPLADKVGWQKKPGDNEEVETLRSNLLTVMGSVARDPEAEAAARTIAEQALTDSGSVAPALAAPALTIAANAGDQTFYEKVLDHLKAAKDPELKNLYERTLVSFHDPRLEERTLQYGLTQARSQDASLFIARVIRDPETEKLAWDFVRNQWTTMEGRSGAFGGSSTDAIVASTSTFCTPELRGQVEAFFSAHPVPSAARTLKQSLEEISYCIDMRGRQGSQLGAWLQEQSAGGRAGK